MPLRMNKLWTDDTFCSKTLGFAGHNSIPFFTRGYPKGIQRLFVMGFDMQMSHSLTLRWQRSALRVRPELTARYIFAETLFVLLDTSNNFLILQIYQGVEIYNLHLLSVFFFCFPSNSVLACLVGSYLAGCLVSFSFVVKIQGSESSEIKDVGCLRLDEGLDECVRWLNGRLRCGRGKEDFLKNNPRVSQGLIPSPIQ